MLTKYFTNVGIIFEGLCTNMIFFFWLQYRYEVPTIRHSTFEYTKYISSVLYNM